MSQDLSGLFEIYQQEPHSFRRDAARIKNWLLSSKRAFYVSISVSFIVHVILIGYICFSSYTLYRYREEPEIVELRPILSALTQIKTEPGNQATPWGKISETDEAEILKLLTQTPLFDASISEEERKELSRKLLEGYFQLKNSNPADSVLPAISLRDLLDYLKDREELGLREKGKYYSLGRFSDSLGPVFFKFNKKSEGQLKLLRRLERYEREGTPVLAGMVTVSSEAGKTDVPADYYFRDCPYDQVLARGASLFYVILGFPSLSQESRVARSVKRAELPASEMTLYQGGLALFIIKAPKPEPDPVRGLGSRPPLRIDADRIEEILDDLMEFREDQQLELFAATYLKKYDPDDDALAELTRNFIYKNLNSVFVLSEPFAAAFDFLEELFYNKELQGYFLSYWKEYPRTKTGAEFLLTLASLYDFERRAIGYLFDSYEIAKGILAGDSRFKRAFNQKAKAFVIKEISQQFIREIKERGILSEEGILQKYRNEQVKIYRTLTEMGGRTRDRALYAWGRLYWDERMYGRAIQKWKEISETFTFKTYQEIKPLLTGYGSISIPVSADNQAFVHRIDKIFEWESAENDNFLFKRLIKYDKWNRRTQR